MRKGGKDIPVTIHNLEEYIKVRHIYCQHRIIYKLIFITLTFKLFSIEQNCCALVGGPLVSRGGGIPANGIISRRVRSGVHTVPAVYVLPRGARRSILWPSHGMGY